MTRSSRIATLLGVWLVAQFLVALTTARGPFGLGPRIVHAQTQATGTSSGEPLVTIFDADLLRDLPTGDNLFTALDILQPSIVSDRFTAGGLETGQAARLGGFLSSFSQTLFRIDGVTFTNPTGSGAPLLFPELTLWDRVTVGTGMFRANTNATGLAIDLTPVAPGDRWVRRLEGSTSHGGLAGHAWVNGPPAIARLDGWDRVSFVASGPIRDRLGAVFAGTWTGASQFSRAVPLPVDAHVASVFSHVIYKRNDRDTIRTVGWWQQRENPLAERNILNVPQATTTNSGAHLQATWNHSGDASTPWAGFVSYSAQRRTPDITLTGTGITERLVDGPVSQFASLSKGSVQTWSIGASVSPGRSINGKTHILTAGVDATGGRDASSSFFAGTVGELVHEGPARVWSFKAPAVGSIRRNLEFGAYLDDRLELTDRLKLDAGLRFQSSTGSAQGAATGIGWHAFLPRAKLEWDRGDRWPLMFAGYSRSIYRLALDDLAFGDPGAPTADVFRWTALAGSSLPLSARGPLVARVGPGTGGDPNFSAIDPKLKTPTADELVLGLQSHLRSNLLFALTGVARAEGDLPAVVNTGAPASTSYTTFTVDDPGGDVLGPEDDRVLTVYNRLPSSFGRDQYLLTTPVQEKATFAGLELSLRWTTSKLLLLFGSTAGLAELSAANRGAGAIENDQGVLGELLSNPNAGELARGRPFSDRAFTIKIAGRYVFPGDVRLGLVARYQDGQSFSRMVIFPGLNQGAEPVRAFTNGESRFLFLATLDGRLTKGLTVAGGQVELFAEAFNLTNRSNAVEEDFANPPNVRIDTAAQPPRVFDLGLRVRF